MKALKKASALLSNLLKTGVYEYKTYPREDDKLQVQGLRFDILPRKGKNCRLFVLDFLRLSLKIQTSKVRISSLATYVVGGRGSGEENQDENPK